MKIFFLIAAAVFSLLSPPELDRCLVGAHFYAWYIKNDWSRISQQALLGKYASREKSVMSQQMSWASEYGVDFFGVEWSGIEKSTDKIIYKYFLKNPNIKKIKWCIAYDSLTRFRGISDPPFDFSNPRIRQGFLTDINYLSRKYFSHPQYLKFQGRPVIWIYIARAMEGDWQSALVEARELVRKNGMELYIDADLLWPERSNWDRATEFDAVSFYVLNQRRLFRQEDIRYTRDVVDMAGVILRKWSQEAPAYKNKFTGEPVAFHPVITPQFIKPADLEALRYSLQSVDDFRRFAVLARETATYNRLAGAKVIWITSWNEWYESTSIEPTVSGSSLQTNYGFQLVEVIREVFGGQDIPEGEGRKISR